MILSLISTTGWSSINEAVWEILSEYKKTQAVEMFEAKLESLDYFCDLKLLLFLLQSGDHQGFLAFKGFPFIIHALREYILTKNLQPWQRKRRQ